MQGQKHQLGGVKITWGAGREISVYLLKHNKKILLVFIQNLKALSL
jgi:hypothetical protein